MSKICQIFTMENNTNSGQKWNLYITHTLSTISMLDEHVNKYGTCSKRIEIVETVVITADLLSKSS